MLKALSAALISGSILLTSGCMTSQSVRASSHTQISPNTQVNVAFSSNDRSYINRYYVQQYRNIKRIPPGHQKHLKRKFKRHHEVPRHVHYTRLPYDLERRLSPLPRDYIRIRIGDEIGIMNVRTRIIYDAMWFTD